MNVENLISISFSESELKEALLMSLECILNDKVQGTPEWNKLEGILSHLKSNVCSMDWSEEKFILSVDGVVQGETWEIK